MKKAGIGFWGGGHMSAAIISGMVTAGFDARSIWVCDRNPSKLEYLASKYGVYTTLEPSEVVKQADVMVLAVKPQGVKALGQQVKQVLKQHMPLMVSVAAGLSCSDLSSVFGLHLPIVRAMPNTPALMGIGATGLFANEHVSRQQQDLVEDLMRSVGVVIWVDQEPLMDVVCSLSGCGPAYFFMFMELLQKSAQKQGLPAKQAKLLTIQTALGAANMALKSGDELEVLRSNVTSKGGMTDAALQSFAQSDMEKIIEQAMTSALARGEDLSRLFGQRKQIEES